mmetsp:Transcript_13078/g.51153  ORF Transcript_13078/g.51153 Transcript_13078/m.51153 type:complete len:201 (-) Transcript_13078:1169-1771(-)
MGFYTLASGVNRLYAGVPEVSMMISSSYEWESSLASTTSSAGASLASTTSDAGASLVSSSSCSALPTSLVSKASDAGASLVSKSSDAGASPTSALTRAPASAPSPASAPPPALAGLYSSAKSFCPHWIRSRTGSLWSIVVKPMSAVVRTPAAHGFGRLRTGHGAPVTTSKHHGAAGIASVYASYPPTPLYSKHCGNRSHA